MTKSQHSFIGERSSPKKKSILNWKKLAKSHGF